jgi:cell division protein FtsI (penicillin-binding protein 3)
LKGFSFVPGQQNTRAVVAAPRRLRFVFLAAIFAGWAFIILVRLFWLQVASYGDYVELAARQQQRTFEVAPRRGVLYDRNMRELAMTVHVDSVYGVPTEIQDKDATATALASVVHSDPTDNFTSARQIDARFHASRNFAWVARKLDPATIARVKDLNLKGIYFQKEFKRFYPNDDLAAQVLGYVGTDDNGLGGLERRFDKDLHGVPGRELTALDARRHVLGSEAREPEPGDNLVLSIDENIQFMAERALDHAMEKFHPLSGTVVIQDPHTGQILALAIRPTYNPNDFRHAKAGLLRNHAVSEVYEPGSTFKLVTYSAALDAAGVQPSDMVDCQGGQITLHGRTIHDDASDRGMGVVTVQRALEKSSDVAAVKMALKVGPDRFYSYMRAFGFGSRSGIQLPSETRGLLAPPKRWGATSIASMAIGHEVAVTPIQLVTMVSTIGNGGMYLPPSILLDNAKPGEALKPAAYHPEQDLPDPLPAGAHRVITPLTSAKMRKMMEGIVLNGTGRTAALNGYSAAGKTGTAQKIDPVTHTYSHTKHVASFAGFAPVNNPAVSIAVIIDSPTAVNDHGTAVSAPVFKEVAQEVLEYLGVPHDEPMRAQPATPPMDLAEDSTPEDSGDLQTMFAEVNNLPADDPLRSGDSQQAAPVSADGEAHGVSTTATVAAPPAPTQMASSTPDAGLHDVTPLSAPAPAQSPQKPENTPENGPLITDAKHRVSVPSFAGASVRQVVERAGTAGLAVQLLGNGLARDQAPAAGTLVPMGTQVVVRFAR